MEFTLFGTGGATLTLIGLTGPLMMCPAGQTGLQSGFTPGVVVKCFGGSPPLQSENTAWRVTGNARSTNNMEKKTTTLL
jgi:hypothetical protein